LISTYKMSNEGGFSINQTSYFRPAAAATAAVAAVGAVAGLIAAGFTLLFP
jgi:predicted Co/Zn/Cd cation transporter (cation efflux family)